MGRENRKESVAAFHRERILCAAEVLFTAQGFEQTTISEIADASGYSRRTVYAYYDSKEEMRRGVVEKALIALEEEMAGAGEQDGFLAQYRDFCQAAVRFHREFPFAAQCLRTADSGVLAASPSREELQRMLHRLPADAWVVLMAQYPEESLLTDPQDRRLCAALRQLCDGLPRAEAEVLWRAAAHVHWE